MNPDGQIIPITEDDQGEGYKDVIDLDEIERLTKFDESDFGMKLRKFQQRKDAFSKKK